MSQNQIGVAVPTVLLPVASIDRAKWAVIACDQFTSEPEYWERVEATVGEAPAEVRLDFLGSGCVGRATPGERDFSRLRGEVRRAAMGIRERDYEASPNYRTCLSCAYRSYCEASAVGP